MIKIIILLAMIELHIIEDFHLQGILAQMKQKKWWEENAPKPSYKYDYIVALIMHSFSWSFFITTPVVIYSSFNITATLLIIFTLNIITHIIVDDLKANKQKINLIIDQTIHLIQILILWTLCVVF